MTQFDLTGGEPRQKKKSASPALKHRANGSGGRATSPEKKVVQVEPPLPTPVSRLERTRRLLLAALRVWELKRRIRD